MDTNDAHRLARGMMDKYGLGDWKFQFDRAVKRFGQCNYSAKTISLSRNLTELNDAAAVKEVMLHEIAHALVGYGHHHDVVWRAAYLRMGGNGERTHSYQTPKLRYLMICPNGHTVQKARRTAGMTERSCSECCPKFDSRYRFSVKDTVTGEITKPAVRPEKIVVTVNRTELEQSVERAKLRVDQRHGKVFS